MEGELEKMEKKLCDAAVENDVPTLRLELQKDPRILDKATLNCQDKNPLHIAAIFGYAEFARVVLDANPDLGFAGDRFGRTPLHLAIIKGRPSVIQALIDAIPLAVREKVEGGGTVLHLCVKHKQQHPLEWLVETIKDEDFANLKDDDGMTILHLAVCADQIETIKYLVQKNIVEVNVKNGIGKTALDLVQGESNSEIAQILEHAGAKRSKDIDSCMARGIEWLSRKRDAIMVVASLIATMAFQAGVNPPGGVWQDDLLDGPHPHFAGVAVMAYKHPRYYRNFIRTNTVAFVSSLSTILFLISGLPFKNRLCLWALMVIMWLTITAIALTYGISIVIVTPKMFSEQLSHVIEISVAVWCGVMSLLLLGNTIRLINRWFKRRHGIDMLEKLRRHGNSATQVQTAEP